ncbi:MAG: hypothetical protein AAGD32_05615 [Planctomycetota bacterium]
MKKVVVGLAMVAVVFLGGTAAVVAYGEYSIGQRLGVAQIPVDPAYQTREAFIEAVGGAMLSHLGLDATTEFTARVTQRGPDKRDLVIVGPDVPDEFCTKVWFRIGTTSEDEIGWDYVAEVHRMPGGPEIVKITTGY